MKVWELIQELEKLPAGKTVKICIETPDGGAVSGDYMVCNRDDGIEITVAFNQREMM